MVIGNVDLTFLDDKKVEKAFRKAAKAQRNGPSEIAGAPGVREIVTDTVHRSKGLHTAIFHNSKPMNAVRDSLKRAIRMGNEWAVKQVNDLKLPQSPVTLLQVDNNAFLFGVDGAEAGELHQDTHRHEWFCLMCLVDNVESFQFCDPREYCKTKFSIMSLLSSELPENDLHDLHKIPSFQVFQDLCRPLDVLMASKKPVKPVGTKWMKGDIVLCRGDIIHANPGYVGYRNVLFFTISGRDQLKRYQPEDQYSACSVLWNLLTYVPWERATFNALADAFINKIQAYKNSNPWNRFSSHKKLFIVMKTFDKLFVSDKDRVQGIQKLVKLVDAEWKQADNEL